MNLSELVAAKTLALSATVVAGITTALANEVNAVPLAWSGLIALVTAAVGYGTLRGKIAEQEKQDAESKTSINRRLKRLDKSNEYVEACVTRIAENLGIPLSDLQASFQSPED